MSPAVVVSRGRFCFRVMVRENAECSGRLSTGIGRVGDRQGRASLPASRSGGTQGIAKMIFALPLHYRTAQRELRPPVEQLAGLALTKE